LTADESNWQAEVPESFDATIKIRYKNRGAAGKVIITGKDSFEVLFEKPIEAITPGQAAVVYRGEYLIGGGIIKGKLSI